MLRYALETNDVVCDFLSVSSQFSNQRSVNFCAIVSGLLNHFVQSVGVQHHRVVQVSSVDGHMYFEGAKVSLAEVERGSRIVLPYSFLKIFVFFLLTETSHKILIDAAEKAKQNKSPIITCMVFH